jgi:hypothetical protein
MTRSKLSAELIALRNAALEDLMALSDEQLAKEIADDGQDISAVARKVGDEMRETAAAVMRDRIVQAKARFKRGDSSDVLARKRPTVERIKLLIQELFQSNPTLGLAFREGKRQTNADWESLYDDLVRMKAIRLDDDN